MAITAIPIFPVKSVSGNQWRSTRLIEESAQTFKLGTPVSIASADGGVQAWNGSTISAGQGAICGISYEAGSNLASTGLGAPLPNQPVVGLGATLTFGSVPNESAAKNIPHGAPINDGRVGFIMASLDSIFAATFGNNGNTATPANTDVGVSYGMTVDTGGNFWYVDKNKTGASAVVQVIGLDLRDPSGTAARVLFKFISGNVQLLG